MRTRDLVLGLVLAVTAFVGAVAAMQIIDDAITPKRQLAATWDPVHLPSDAFIVPLHPSEDGGDVPIAWVDITRVSLGRGWRIDLAEAPPQANGDGLRPFGGVVSYGLVFETTSDGIADYVVGIRDLRDGRGYRVWLTDVAAGDTTEQLGGPYGFPVEFIHPDEEAPASGRAGAMTFLFLTGSTPSGLDETSRFYAWATLEDATGTIVAADFAPDDAWTGIVLDRTSFP